MCLCWCVYVTIGGLERFIENARLLANGNTIFSSVPVDSSKIA